MERLSNMEGRGGLLTGCFTINGHGDWTFNWGPPKVSIYSPLFLTLLRTKYESGGILWLGMQTLSYPRFSASTS